MAIRKIKHTFAQTFNNVNEIWFHSLYNYSSYSLKKTSYLFAFNGA